jgi:ribosome maturation factor RimP
MGFTKPIFFCGWKGVVGMADLWQVVESAARDVGFELVDLERTPGGMVRVFIDTLDHSRMVSVDDCELVSKQLVHQLPVEGFDFQRLEVSSPGMDRPLTKLEHYLRFAGQAIKLRLKLPLEGRRNFEGLLVVGPDQALSLHWEAKPGEVLELKFELQDVDRARLVPQVKF